MRNASPGAGREAGVSFPPQGRDRTAGVPTPGAGLRWGCAHQGPGGALTVSPGRKSHGTLAPRPTPHLTSPPGYGVAIWRARSGGLGYPRLLQRGSPGRRSVPRGDLLGKLRPLRRPGVQRGAGLAVPQCPLPWVGRRGPSPVARTWSPPPPPARQPAPAARPRRAGSRIPMGARGAHTDRTAACQASPSRRAAGGRLGPQRPNPAPPSPPWPPTPRPAGLAFPTRDPGGGRQWSAGAPPAPCSGNPPIPSPSGWHHMSWPPNLHQLPPCSPAPDTSARRAPGMHPTPGAQACGHRAP